MKHILTLISIIVIIIACNDKPPMPDNLPKGYILYQSGNGTFFLETEEFSQRRGSWNVLCPNALRTRQEAIDCAYDDLVNEISYQAATHIKEVERGK